MAEEKKKDRAQPLTGEQALAATLSHFDLIFRAVSDAVVFTDLDRRITLINAAFTDLFGYTHDEVRGRHTRIIYTSREAYEEQGRIRFNLDADEKFKPYEVSYRKKNGAVFPSETVGTVVKDAADNVLGFLGIIRDISVRKGLEKNLHDTLATLENRVQERTAALRETNEKLAAEVDRHRQTGEALRKSEEKFRSLYLSMNEGVCLHKIIYDSGGQPVDYRILDVNPAYEAILGLRVSEVAGRLATEVYGGDGPPYLEIYAQVAETGAPRSFETYFSPMDRFFRISVFSPQRGRFATLFSDISRSRKSEQALQDALAKARAEKAKSDALLAAIGDGVSIQDREFRIIYQNDVHKNLVGEHLGRYCYESYGQRRTVCDRCPVAMSYADGRIHTVEREVSAGGDRRYLEITASPLFDESGRITAGIEVVRDITRRRHNEEAIRNNEATLRSIMLAAPIGIGLVRDRVFSWVNDAMLQMTGYLREELIGRSTRMLYPSEEEFLRVGGINDKQLENADVGETDTVWRCKNGGLIDVQLRSSPINPGDHSQGVTFTALDITERKKAFTEKINLEKQIQHVQKLESLGVLAGGIAHDFNNLLMAILGNADLALAQISPVAPGRENIVAIEKASQRAAELCKQMLAYSGKGKFVLKALNLTEVVREMGHILEVSIAKTVVLKYNFAEPLPAVMADPTQIHQVVMNLIVNASEAIGIKSGVISITTGAMECDRSYLAETYLDEELVEGPYVYVEVADTGSGMDKETRTRLFDPFFTTKFTGRGLGMSAVLGIVRGHHGAIKIYSEQGKGTTVKVLFPAEKGLLPVSGQKEVPGGQQWQGQGLILLVDDEETVRTVGKQMLEFLGFSVVTAADGIEALARYREYRDTVRCVILDLTMPHMGGAETFRELRRINQGVRVIMSSGYNEQEVTQHFVGKGIAGFIQKPYQLAELTTKLREIL